LELELEMRRKIERTAWEVEELVRGIGAWD